MPRQTISTVSLRVVSLRLRLSILRVFVLGDNWANLSCYGLSCWHALITSLYRVHKQFQIHDYFLLVDIYVSVIRLLNLWITSSTIVFSWQNARYPRDVEFRALGTNVKKYVTGKNMRLSKKVNKKPCLIKLCSNKQQELN